MLVINISATMLRQALVEDDKETWFRYHNPRLYKYYDVIRGQLLALDCYKQKTRNKWE